MRGQLSADSGSPTVPVSNQPGSRTSFGHVIIRGNWSGFSFWPLTMASRMEGWSEPRLTKTWETPA
jgi:hypothetical protein